VTAAEAGAAMDHRGRPRIAVTGIGVKTPAGQTVEELWDTLVAARPAAAPITLYDASRHSVRFACEVRDFDPVPYVGPKEVRRTDRAALLAVAAAADAVGDATGVSMDPTGELLPAPSPDARCAALSSPVPASGASARSRTRSSATPKRVPAGSGPSWCR
jgi:3-oxoacyl-[acyl-carrier-protein] synthase II